MIDESPPSDSSPGRLYEQSLARVSPERRKAHGIYYTPAELVAHVVQHTLGPLLEGKTPQEARHVTVLDPACGGGAFLVGAYQYLLDWYCDWYVRHGTARQLTRTADGRWALRDAEKRSILLQSIHGIDIDPCAIELTRQALAPDSPLDLTGNIAHSDALIGPHSTSYTAVIGNPPWGQKDIDKDEALRRHLQERYPSAAGIFDRFRPFVELAVRLTAPGGRFGMVLPDIVLLKDYPQTRRYLLDHLALERIDTWGMAFSGAVIDTVSIIGSKQAAPVGHTVTATVIENGAQRTHVIPQTDFGANPRHVFNLHLTPQRRHVLDRLAPCPRLGDYFEVHEGVHSGNIRAELFVSDRLDDSCRELIFGRDEIAPYSLHWQGRYVRCSAVPRQRNRQRYANLGRPEWHERTKLLVRRTGDHVRAAVDRHGRHASNNFFLVFPKRPSVLDLDGLCALLNSRFMTWYFRTIEPRRGRAFAELKIKHLAVFPLPVQSSDGTRLNELGRRRIMDPALDATIDELVRDLFGLREVD